jgi:cyclic pyranopterin phosphate synthase
LQGVRGVIGMIAPVTEPFCGDCRRMRVSADGRLFPCLLDGRWVDLSEAWANPLEADLDTAVAERLVHAGVWEKPFRGRQQTTAMVTLGG